MSYSEMHYARRLYDRFLRQNGNAEAAKRQPSDMMWKKLEKRWKKVLTRRGRCDILTELPARAVSEKKQIEKVWKRSKKVLDKRKGLWYSKSAVNKNGKYKWRNEKKFEKTWKKFLTNDFESDILNNVPLMRRVPCKLNNETNEKHQKVLKSTD